MCCRRKSYDPDLEDGYVTADNIREGVKNGWYEAVLLRKDNEPFVRVTGVNTRGQQVDEIFHISQEDFDTLQAEGYLIELGE